MKKILYLIVTIFTFTLITNNVYASSFGITLDGDTNFTDEISIDVLVNNLTGFTNGFYGLDATLSYDKTKVELKEITSSTAYTLTYDKTISDRFVVLTDTGVSNNTKLATLVFENKALSSNESTTITLTNMIGSDGEEDITFSGTISKQITLSNAPSYQKGDLNKDGTINLPDVIRILRIYLGIDTASSEDTTIGDMNNDGDIGLADVIALLRKYLGID